MSESKSADKPVTSIETQIKQLQAQLAHTERVRDAALHDVVYLRGRLDGLLGLVPARTDTPETSDTRKANAEEKIRAVIEKNGTTRAKKTLKQTNPPAGQAD